MLNATSWRKTVYTKDNSAQNPALSVLPLPASDSAELRAFERVIVDHRVFVATADGNDFESQKRFGHEKSTDHVIAWKAILDQSPPELFPSFTLYWKKERVKSWTRQGFLKCYNSYRHWKARQAIVSSWLVSRCICHSYLSYFKFHDSLLFLEITRDKAAVVSCTWCRRSPIYLDPVFAEMWVCFKFFWC